MRRKAIAMTLSCALHAALLLGWNCSRRSLSPPDPRPRSDSPISLVRWPEPQTGTGQTHIAGFLRVEPHRSVRRAEKTSSSRPPSDAKETTPSAREAVVLADTEEDPRRFVGAQEVVAGSASGELEEGTFGSGQPGFGLGRGGAARHEGTPHLEGSAAVDLSRSEIDNRAKYGRILARIVQEQLDKDPLFVPLSQRGAGMKLRLRVRTDGTLVLFDEEDRRFGFAYVLYSQVAPSIERATLRSIRRASRRFPRHFAGLPPRPFVLELTVVHGLDGRRSHVRSED